MPDHNVEPHQKISHYQLQNLLNARVPFLFIDIRSEDSRSSDQQQHPLLARSVQVQTNNLLDYLKSVSAEPNAAIVLICENGSKSIAALTLLSENSYINAFAVEGGVEALPRI